MRSWLARVLRDPADYVDVEDVARRHAIAEAEYQQRADADSQIQRISGRRPYGPYRRLAGLLVIERIVCR